MSPDDRLEARVSAPARLKVSLSLSLSLSLHSPSPSPLSHTHTHTPEVGECSSGDEGDAGDEAIQSGREKESGQPFLLKCCSECRKISQLDSMSSL